MTKELSNFCEQQLIDIHQYMNIPIPPDQQASREKEITKMFTNITKEIQDSPCDSDSIEQKLENITDLQELNNKLDSVCHLISGRGFLGFFKKENYKEAEKECKKAKQRIEERIKYLSSSIKNSDINIVKKCIEAIKENVRNNSNNVIKDVFRFVEIEKTYRSLDTLLKIYPYGGWILKSDQREQVESACSIAKQEVLNTLDQVNNKIEEFVLEHMKKFVGINFSGNSARLEINPNLSPSQIFGLDNVSLFIPLRIAHPINKNATDTVSFFKEDFKKRLEIIPPTKWHVFTPSLEKTKKIFLKNKNNLEILLETEKTEKARLYNNFLLYPEFFMSSLIELNDVVYEDIFHFLNSQKNSEQALATLSVTFPLTSNLLLIREGNKWNLYRMNEIVSGYLKNGEGGERSKKLIEEFLINSYGNFDEKRNKNEIIKQVYEKFKNACPDDQDLPYLNDINWDKILKEKGWTWVDFSRYDYYDSKSNTFRVPTNLTESEENAYKQFLKAPAQNVQMANQLLQSSNMSLKMLVMSILKEALVKDSSHLTREEISDLLVGLLMQQKSTNRDQLLDILFNDHPTQIPPFFNLSTSIYSLEFQSEAHLKQITMSFLDYKLDTEKIVEIVENGGIFFLLEGIAQIEEMSEARHSLLNNLLRIITDAENFQRPYRTSFSEIYKSIFSQKIQSFREEMQQQLPSQLAPDQAPIFPSVTAQEINNYFNNTFVNQQTRNKIQSHFKVIETILKLDPTLLQKLLTP